MPVGEGALRRVRREVGAEPLLLGRACAHVDLGVQRHDVPAAEIVAVVALAGVAGGDAEVTEIARRPGLLIVVVARHRVRALAVAAPAGREAILVVRIGAVRVRVVAQQEHRTRDSIEQPASGQRVRLGAGADVAGADEHLRCAGGLDEGRERIPPRGPVSSGDTHPYGIAAGRTVRVAGGEERGQRRHASLRGGPVAPLDCVAPGRVVLDVRQSEGKPGGAAGLRAEIRSRIDCRGNVGGRCRTRGVVTGRGPRVARALSRDRDELPAVVISGQGQFQHAVGRRSHLAVGRDHGGRPDGLPSRAHVDLPDPVHRICDPVGRHRGEALIIMLRPVQHEVHARGVQAVPQRLERRACSPS